MVRGSGVSPLAGELGADMTICRDAVFPDLLSLVDGQGLGLVLVPSHTGGWGWILVCLAEGPKLSHS